MRINYTQITKPELDDVIRNILQEFPNSGYKSLRGHLLARGLKVQERRLTQEKLQKNIKGFFEIPTHC